jgi:hypothetical protein
MRAAGRRRGTKGAALWEKGTVVLASGAALAGGEAIKTGHTSVITAITYVLVARPRCRASTSAERGPEAPTAASKGGDA